MFVQEKISMVYLTFTVIGLFFYFPLYYKYKKNLAIFNDYSSQTYKLRGFLEEILVGYGRVCLGLYPANAPKID